MKEACWLRSDFTGGRVKALRRKLRGGSHAFRASFGATHYSIRQNLRRVAEFLPFFWPDAAIDPVPVGFRALLIKFQKT